ncbi:MAG TPA: energy transducer TonB [Candidatus Angelobacter sp.]|nr:energy transducer TonB [Candidatus Angelobacter sp.]
MNRTVCFLLLVLGLTFVPSARADSLKDDLNHRYKNQVLALRYPFVQGDQNFDGTGHPLSNPSGAWWIYGAIFVHDLHVSAETLRLEGPRVALTPPKGSDKPVAVPVGDAVKIEIHLDHPLASIDEAQALLNRVFYLDANSLLYAKPEYRRADVAAHDEQEVYKVGNSGDHSVKPPRATYTPEPDYSETARRAQVQGMVILSIVVDKKGSVSRIRIEQPLGMGMDENAVEAVKLWRFNPATRNGEPVPVEMKIEVSFNLYSSPVR